MAYDADATSSEMLGVAIPLPYATLMKDEEEQTHELNLYSNFKKSGVLKFRSKYI